MLIVLATSGCAVKRINVTYYSDPPGALLYDGEKSLGFAPYSVNYTISKEQLAAGKIYVKDYKLNVSARWKSGARANTPSGIYFDISKASPFKENRYYYVMKRPANYPDLEGDIANGEHIRQMQRLKAEAEYAAARAAKARAAADAAADKAARDRQAAEDAYYRNDRY